MSDLDVTTSESAGAEVPATQPETSGAPPARKTRRLDRETRLMLVIPPLLVALVFAGYVWWRQTADLTGAELEQLAWPKFWTLLGQHVRLTFVSSALVVAIAVPLGIALTRGPVRRFSPFVVAVANAGQGAPSVGLIVLLAIWQGYGFWTAVMALTLYGLLPVLRNTITGLDGVDPTLIEAGRGLGMSSASVLLRIELPLALPVIMAGVRTALVLVVGTATLATFIAAGGLGEIIQTGISLALTNLMVAGAVLVAMLALLIEWLGRVLELIARPKGV